jgi:hypothetical protein
VQKNSICVIDHNYLKNGCTFNRSKRLDSWEDDNEDWIANYFISTGIGEDNTFQSMNVKSYVKNNSIHIIRHNYINNGCTFNQGKRLDSWEDEDEDWIANYFISTEICGDNTYQSMNVKSYVQNNSIRIIHHNYINNSRTFNQSKRMDSWEDDNEDWSLGFFILTEIGGDSTYRQSMNVKSCVQNNSICIIYHNYMNNGRTFNQSEQKDSWEDDDED